MPSDANVLIDLVTFLEQEVLPQLDRAQIFADLTPVDKGAYYQCTCPQCQQRRAYIYKSGDLLKCNRLNNCGYSVSILAYMSDAIPPRGRAFVAAVRRLAELAGVPFPDLAFPPQEVIRARAREVRTAMLVSVRAITQRMLWSQRGEAARRYLQRVRGFSRRDIWNLGFGLYPSVEVLRQRFRADGYGDAEIDAAGVVWDKFEGYLTIPWDDEVGRPLTLYGRWPDQALPLMRDHPGWRPRRRALRQAWQRRSPAAQAEAPWQEPTLPKTLALPGEGTKRSPLYLDRALRASLRDVVAVEGPLDAGMAQRRGDLRVITGVGASLSGAQIETLRQRQIRTVTLCFDPDAGGAQGTVSTFTRLAAAEIVTFVAPTLPGGRDPDEFIRRYGIDAWRMLIGEAISGAVYLGQQYLREVTPTSREGVRQTAVERILDLIATLRGPRTALDRDELLRLTAERTGYGADALVTFASEYAVRQQRLETTQTLDRSLRQARAALVSQVDVQAVTRALSTTLATLQVQTEEPPPTFSVERLNRESRQLRRGRSSGWVPVDQLGIDFQPGELTIVGARTGHCKTSFLVGLLSNWLQDEDPSTSEEIVLCYTLEEPEIRIYHRLLTLLSVEAGDGWMVNEVRDYLQGGGRLVPTDGRRKAETIETAKAQLRRRENRLQIIYRPLWTIDQLVAHARDLAQRRRIGGILIDYLQRILPPTGKLERRDLEVSVIGRRLKALAVDIATPVVVTAQINREAVRDAVKIPMDLSYTNDKVQNALRSRRPELHQLREGGAEQEADQVVGLMNFIADCRQDVEIRGLPMRAPGSAGEATRLEVGVLKSRFGQVGQWDALAFEGRFHRLRNPSSRTEV